MERKHDFRIAAGGDEFAMRARPVRYRVIKGPSSRSPLPGRLWLPGKRESTLPSLPFSYCYLRLSVVTVGGTRAGFRYYWILLQSCYKFSFSTNFCIDDSLLYGHSIRIKRVKVQRVISL
jgi:hypothetical protein